MSGKDTNFNILLASRAVYDLAIHLALVYGARDELVKAQVDVLAGFAYNVAIEAAIGTVYAPDKDIQERVGFILNYYKGLEAADKATDMLTQEVSFGSAIADWMKSVKADGTSPFLLTRHPATPEGRKANAVILNECISNIAKATGRENKPSSIEAIETISKNIHIGYSFGLDCIKFEGAASLDPELWALFLGIRKSFLIDMKKSYVEAGGNAEDLKKDDDA